MTKITGQTKLSLSCQVEQSFVLTMIIFYGYLADWDTISKVLKWSGKSANTLKLKQEDSEVTYLYEIL